MSGEIVGGNRNKTRTRYRGNWRGKMRKWGPEKLWGNAALKSEKERKILKTPSERLGGKSVKAKSQSSDAATCIGRAQLRSGYDRSNNVSLQYKLVLVRVKVRDKGMVRKIRLPAGAYVPFGGLPLSPRKCEYLSTPEYRSRREARRCRSAHTLFSPRTYHETHPPRAEQKKGVIAKSRFSVYCHRSKANQKEWPVYERTAADPTAAK